MSPTCADSTHPEYWNNQYRLHDMPWDLQGVPTMLLSFLTRPTQPGRVLIPACGRGHEIRAFADRGWDVVGLDFSLEGVALAKRQLGIRGDKVLFGDFFTHDFGDARFDLVYERAFLCCLPPSRRVHYLDRVTSLLCPGGKLVGFFLYGAEPEPPPFPLNEMEAEFFFGHNFELIRSAQVENSPPLFAGRELWQEWEKR